MSNRIILGLTIVISAVFAITVNEIVLAEPEEFQEDGIIIIGNKTTTIEESNITIVKPSNITLPQNLTKVLQLRINFTNENFDLDSLREQGYVIRTHIKSNLYNDRMEFPISDFLVHNPILLIPIVNTSTDTDNGGDFRIDVSINQFDDTFEKVNYPISRNAVYGSVNIDNMLRHVINDEIEEGNYDEDPNYESYADNNKEYALNDDKIEGDQED